MLNLRSLEPRNPGSKSENQRFSRFSMPNFRVPQSFLGNIGEPLDYSGALVDENEYEDNGIGQGDLANPVGLLNDDKTGNDGLGVCGALPAADAAQYVSVAGPSHGVPELAPQIGDDEYIPPLVIAEDLSNIAEDNDSNIERVNLHLN